MAAIRRRHHLEDSAEHGISPYHLEARGPSSGGRVEGNEGNFCQEIVRNVKKSNTAPPKQTVRTCQEAIPKGKKSSSNHEFSGAIAATLGSGRLIPKSHQDRSNDQTDVAFCLEVYLYNYYVMHENIVS